MSNDLLREILIEIQRLTTRLVGLETHQKPALTVEEAGEWLGCGRTQIHQLVRSGQLRKLPKLGKKTRVSVSSVTRLVVASKAERKRPTDEKATLSQRVLTTRRGERMRQLRDEMMKITL